MPAFVLSRLGQGLLVMWGIVTLLFGLFALQGDPVEMMVGQNADAATREAIRIRYHLDEPVWMQYILYLHDLSPIGKDASGSFGIKSPSLGTSLQAGKPVVQLILDHMPGSAVLAGVSVLLASVLGISMGIVSALKPNGLLDRTNGVLAQLGMSAPSFWVAVILIWIFAIVLGPWTGLPANGYWIRDSVFSLDTHADPRYMVLPALALGIRPLSVIFMLSRGGLIEIMQGDYVRTARAKGLHETIVVFRHALRNSLPPVITAVSGWLASLLAGAFFIEYMFNWKGLGSLTIGALYRQDFPLLSGCILLTGAIFIMVNMLVEICYAWLDPRIRLNA